MEKPRQHIIYFKNLCYCTTKYLVSKIIEKNLNQIYEVKQMVENFYLNSILYINKVLDKQLWTVSEAEHLEDALGEYINNIRCLSGKITNFNVEIRIKEIEKIIIRLNEEKKKQQEETEKTFLYKTFDKYYEKVRICNKCGKEYKGSQSQTSCYFCYKQSKGTVKTCFNEGCNNTFQVIEKNYSRIKYCTPCFLEKKSEKV